MEKLGPYSQERLFNYKLVVACANHGLVDASNDPLDALQRARDHQADHTECFNLVKPVNAASYLYALVGKNDTGKIDQLDRVEVESTEYHPSGLPHMGRDEKFIGPFEQNNARGKKKRHLQRIARKLNKTR